MVTKPTNAYMFFCIAFFGFVTITN